MRYVELFAGVGGFRLGIEKASERLARDGQKAFRVPVGQEKEHGPGKHSPQAERPDGRAGDGTHPESVCVYANEWDRHAAEIYKRRWGGVDSRDITTVRASEIPEHDLLTGGFPCQAFSVAGKRRGFEETRGTLFFDICRIIRHHRTPYLFLENVKGLLNHDGGKTFQTILGSLDELGYDCQWQVLNSKDFGVPQNRERVFIVGHLRGRARPEVFPFGEGDGVHPETRREPEEEVAPTLHAAGGGPDINDQYVEVPSATKRGYEKARPGDSINMAIPNSTTRRGRVGKSVAQTVDTGAQQAVVQAVDTKQQGKARFTDKVATLGANDYKEPKGVAIENRIRRLTPTECERLQGFPDGWTEEASDTQRYRMMGNAVTVNVIEAIATRLFQVR